MRWVEGGGGPDMLAWLHVILYQNIGAGNVLDPYYIVSVL